MTKDELVRAIAKDAQKRATIKDGITVRIAYLREAEAILESIESAGWTVVQHEAAPIARSWIHPPDRACSQLSKDPDTAGDGAIVGTSLHLIAR
jgi:hypothetical protein